MVSYLKYITLIGLSLFFSAFGVMVLIASYKLTNPFEFIMTLFAANFIILISAALCIGFVIKLIRLSRHGGQPPPATSSMNDESSATDK